MSEVFQKRLGDYLAAGYSAVWVETPEEIRIATDLMQLVHSLRDKGRRALKPIARVCSWSMSKGWMQSYPRPKGDQNPPKTGESMQPPEALSKLLNDEPKGTMLVCQDFETYLQVPRVRRLLRDCAAQLREEDKAIILVSVSVTLPSDLSQDILVMDYPLPTEQELGVVLDELISRNDMDKVEGDERERLIEAAKGLTSNGAEDAYALSLIEEGAFTPSVVSREKSAAVAKSGALSIFEPKDVPDVGGMEALKEWLSLRRLSMTKDAREFGIPAAKGLMLLGLSGCGKSLTAKTVGKVWGIPLVRFDISSIMAGRVGASEENMRIALRLAEAVAPCVLWIDEVDKGFAGVKGSAGGLDSGVKAGVFGTFITWMQEKKAPVFVVATANDVEFLPPELMRKGRFDEVFFVDLPTLKAREAILKIHLEKRRRSLSDREVSALAARMDKFTGAEIEETVTSALLVCYQDNKRDIKAEDVAVAADLTTPIADTMKETVDGLREWAKGRARDAEKASRRPKIDLGLVARRGRKLRGSGRGGAPEDN